MSGKPATAKSLYVPPPIDGLNLIASPPSLLPTEARRLDNYFVYDSGIRQVGAPAAGVTSGNVTDIAMMFSYIEASTNTPRMLYATDNKIFKLATPTSSSGTDITGANVITSNRWNACFFNKRIFLFNGVDAPLIHDLGVGNIAAFGGTGPASVPNCVQASGYKNRLYVVYQFSTSVWYGEVDAITGAFTELDLGTIFSIPGYLVCCFNWTYNQGNGNEELMVFINSEGEALIYSGDSPEAPNWQLIGRARLPKFVDPTNTQAFVRVSGDVYLSTVRGLISMSSVFTGALQQRPYYTLSRKIRDVVRSKQAPVVDPDSPFLFIGGGYMGGTTEDVFILNYERGAWSKITMSENNDGMLQSMCIFNGYLMMGYSDLKIYNLPILEGVASVALTYRWYTPFFDFGSNMQKHLKMIRVLALNYGLSSTVKNTVSVSNDFVEAATAITDTKSTAVAADVNCVQELAPPGVGRRLSFMFARQGVSGITERNEIQGFEVFVEEGGAY